MKKTLLNYFLFFALTLLVIMAAAISIITYINRSNYYDLSMVEVREKLTENYKNELKSRVEIIEQYIQNENLRSEQRLKDSISARVEEAYMIANSLYIKYKDIKSQKEIKELIKSALRDIRFNNGRGYYFIDDFDGVCILYPMRPDLEDKNIINLQDINKKYVIQDIINVAQAYGSGFSEYMTYKYKFKENAKRYRKIAYVKKFEPYDWAIGAGEFLDDVENDIKKEIIQNINKMKLSNSTNSIDILEIHNYQGGEEFATIVANPNREDMCGKKISSKDVDVDGKKYQEDMLKVIDINGDGFVTYKSKKLNTNEVFLKLEYFKKLDTWDWVILSGINIDDIDKDVSRNQEELKLMLQASSQKTIFAFLGVFGFLIGFSFLISKKITTEIDKNYYKDQLTSLNNRHMFSKTLEEAINPVVFIFDIDGFKNINDFYGTHSGDELLVKVAHFIKNFAQQNSLIPFRLSSDEFAIYLDKIVDDQYLTNTMNQFFYLFSQEEFYDNTKRNRLNIELSCGVANEKQNILGKADIALNYAKKKKIPYAIYDAKNPHMNTYKHNIYWREKIQWAINEDLFVPFFQPIIDTRDKSYKKYEALIRIKDGDEVVSPYMFLDVAKETKLYPALTKVMIEKTFAKFQGTKIEFSINIALQDIEDENTIEFLIHKIDEFNIQNQLILEILESDDIIQSEKFLPFVEKMRTKGVRFALDDFGSGYSNFAFLLKMHPKFLKIDGSLIKRITTDQNSYHIVETIVLFAKQMNSTIIAEFVENEEIVKTLQKLDIFIMQGYHFAPPSQELV